MEMERDGAAAKGVGRGFTIVPDTLSYKHTHTSREDRWVDAAGGEM